MNAQQMQVHTSTAARDVSHYEVAGDPPLLALVFGDVLVTHRMTRPVAERVAHLCEVFLRETAPEGCPQEQA